MKDLFRPRVRLFLKDGAMRLARSSGQLLDYPDHRDIGLVVGETQTHWAVQVAGFTSGTFLGVGLMPKEYFQRHRKELL